MPKRSDETLFNIVEVSECLPSSQSELRELVREGAFLTTQVKRLDEVKKRLAQIIIEEQGIISDDGKYGVRDGPHCVVVRQQSGRETINRELLIENGVTPDQIKASMKVGKGFNVVEFNEMTGD